MLAPASARPRAMPSPMPPLPPVTIATLPRRSNRLDVMLCIPWFLLLVALPDQHQPEACHGGAIAGPLQLVDHEARSWPGDRARALSDPEQPDDEGKQACYQQKSAHAFLPMGLLLSQPTA